jgi:hypothetical protein
LHEYLGSSAGADDPLVVDVAANLYQVYTAAYREAENLKRARVVADEVAAKAELEKESVSRLKIVPAILMAQALGDIENAVATTADQAWDQELLKQHQYTVALRAGYKHYIHNRGSLAAAAAAEAVAQGAKISFWPQPDPEKTAPVRAETIGPWRSAGQRLRGYGAAALRWVSPV